MIDLHSHTTRSDGDHTPAQLVDLAKEIGLSAIAITDHDTTAGLDEAIAEGKKIGIKVVPGVELSTKLDGHDVHIVGLFIDKDNPDFAEFLFNMRDLRMARNMAMAYKLTECCPGIEMEDFPELNEDVVMTKGNFARVIIEKGYAADTTEAISKYLLKGCPAYVPRPHATPKAAIDIIHKAGGKAFLAHFNQIVRKDREKSERYARQIVEMGADGLETRYSEFDDDYRERAERIAREYGLLRSGGSDFHGDIKPKISLGSGMGDLEVPDDFLIAIEAAL